MFIDIVWNVFIFTYIDIAWRHKYIIVTMSAIMFKLSNCGVYMLDSDITGQIQWRYNNNNSSPQYLIFYIN